MANFPHLRLPFKVDGSYIVSTGGLKKKNPLTDQNKANRATHGQSLKSSIDNLLRSWDTIKQQRANVGFALPNENDIPIFLRIDNVAFLDIDSFQNWGIEVIAEEEDGYIIGASVDGFAAFKKNLDEFLQGRGRYKDKAAQIWEIITDENWRVQQILKGDLNKIWRNLDESTEYIIELGVSCYVPNRIKYPTPQQFDTEEKYIAKLVEFEENEKAVQIQRGDKQLLREEEVDRYLRLYNGELMDIWDNDVDAIFFKAKINGKGLRDIVQTYQYLYRVSLPESYTFETANTTLSSAIEVTIIPPDVEAPKICVIDSGIMESHPLLISAIDPNESRSYVPGDPSTADYVRVSGHGTKVAGAILYPRLIPKEGNYKLESRLQNARILDSNNKISDREFAPALIEKIVQQYHPGTKIFNLSINEGQSYNGTHMPELAGAIDKLIHEKDILFILSSGNIKRSTGNDDIKGVKEHYESGEIYPNYLFQNYSGIANPGVSYFGITVGSISHASYEDDDYHSLAGQEKVSPFSRSGLGMWNCIKPEVVEYGGDFIKNKNSNEIITHKETSPELINSTLYGATAWGRDDVGTSFAAPKVSHIASRLQKELPNDAALMYKALIVQSARLPSHCFTNPTLNDIRCYGYGIPDVDRAIDNFERRITFIKSGSTGAKKADIYRLNMPRELRGEGKRFKILVEVTLAFTSKTRLTRKGAHSYLSSWLEWKSSNYNESFESFRNKTINYLDLDDSAIDEGGYEEGDNPMKWTIRENVNWGLRGVSRNYNTVQKDWTIVEPHQFAENFNLAVIGHAGWDKNLKNTIPYALCVSFEIIDGNIDIYNLIAQAQIETEEEVES